MDWCHKREINPLHPAVSQLAEFFLFLFREKNLAVSSIKGYRAAIAHTWRSSKVFDSSVDPVINKLFAGFSIERPRTPVVAPPWSLSVVLHYLMGPPFEPLAKAQFKHLLLKTVFLLAFATAARRSELHALSAEPGCIAFASDGSSVTLRAALDFVAKNQAPEEARQPWVIKALYSFVEKGLPDRTLCPVRALKRYCDVSAAFRQGRRKLLISMQLNKKEDVSKETVSRWISVVIKDALREAGTSDSLRSLANVTAHQVRAMATSWATFSGAPLQQVREAAFWKGQSTFSSFYLRDLASQVNDISSLGSLVAAQSVCQGLVSNPQAGCSSAWGPH